MSRLFMVLIVGLVVGVVFELAAEDKEKPKEKPAAKATPKEPAKPKAKKNNKKKVQEPALAEAELDGAVVGLASEGHQIDFPDSTVGKDGTIWICWIDHAEGGDIIKLGTLKDGTLEETAALGEKGIMHQPSVAVDGAGTVWGFWGQTGEDDVVHLYAAGFSGGKAGEPVCLAQNPGADTYCDSGTDSKGRAWVVWQSMRSGSGGIYSRYFDPAGEKWSEEVQVSESTRGNWEPRIAFDSQGTPWVVYDSSEGNEFNIQLARVGENGEIKRYPIAHSPRYEARASIHETADGSGFWIASERGRVRWGLDVRGHDPGKGINSQKDFLFGKFDIASETFTEVDPGKAARAGAPVNLPAIGVDADGNPWLAYRYFERILWRVAVTRYDVTSDTWSEPRRIPESSFGQDRRLHFVSKDSGLWLNWPSDLRKTKASEEAGVYLAKLGKPAESVSGKDTWQKPTLDEPFAASQATPERVLEDHNEWTIGGETYHLYWGDLHRHTDVSNCRTGFDGCINEHFRYAYDMAKLDFLGTSDHTDVGKIYSPYEWWHNQRMHDVFHRPEQFQSLYVYEREQKWPWGHRNIVFAQRGGPVIYINRTTYRKSIWQNELPVKAGLGEIDPYEVWDILDRYGEPVAVISHTGGTRMGTDWSRYDRIDYDVEAIVEIYQGARVSYEGLGVPQPTVGLRPDEEYTANSGADPPKPPAAIETFGEFDPGVYQNALTLGRKLGVFASSDHISQHVSYGGVYCKDFTREGIIEGFLARRTVAATDKIYVEFTVNDSPLGQEIEASGDVTLRFRIEGTEDLKKVTVIRNEEDFKVIDIDTGKDYDGLLVDTAPSAGENRYYLRIEQVDGNMAWSSPVWVKPAKN